MKSPSLTKRILSYAATLPEGVPLMAKALLQLGSRAAIDQSLARLTRDEKLIRSDRGLYLRPIETRFGTRAPSPDKVVLATAKVRGETIAPHGASAANRLGLTSQVPMSTVYLTSGRTRRLTLGAQTIELRHVPRWQLTNARRSSGEVIRALAWAGRSQARQALGRVKKQLRTEVRAELLASRNSLPEWLAQVISNELGVKGSGKTRRFRRSPR